MRSQKARVLVRKDGRDLVFCHQKLKNAIDEYVAQKRTEGVKVSKTELRQNLADHLDISPEAIKNYVYGYNGPMDIKVVEKMADFLGLECIELMREASPMAENKIRTIEKTMTNPKEDQVKQATDNGYSISEFDRMTARDAVKEVYRALRIFVSYFEGEYDVPLNLEDEGVNDIIAAYHFCWRVMHDHMLDIPERTYNALSDFMRELRYWIYDLPQEEIDENGFPTEEPREYHLNYFGQLLMVGALDGDDSVDPFEWADYVTGLLIDAFYSGLGEILHNYRPAEPYRREDEMGGKRNA